MAGECILVVDDEPTVLQACVRALTRRGFDARAAGGGLEALALLCAEHFDLLLTDLKMPGIDGLELLRRAREADPRLLAVVMTGYGTVETHRLSIELGVSGLVAKPFTLQDLTAAIGDALEKARVARETACLEAQEAEASA